MLLVWVRGNSFECYSIKTILDKYGSGIHQADDINEGIVKSNDNKTLITSVAFSPDGTTLAIGCEDGYIRFYQIYLHEPTPRCLHSWMAHDGSPVSSFFFLDNHTQPIVGNTLWKYVVTLANNNTEIQVTRCDGWKVLQTIKFNSTTDQPLSFKAEIDRTSSYLILNDMSNRQFYVLHILKENALSQKNGSSGSGDEQNSNGNSNNELLPGGISRVFVKSIGEFQLASTVLSYGISNASIRRYKCALSENYLIDELEDFDEENIVNYCVVLKLFMIHPESVQECHIFYQAALNQSAELDSEAIATDLKLPTQTISSSSTTSLQLLNSSNASATSSTTATAAAVAVVSADGLKTPSQKSSQLNLLTPDSFSSPIDKQKTQEVSQDVLSTIFMLANQTSPGIANKSVEGANVINLANCALIEEEKIFQQKMAAEIPPVPLPIKFASGGSSPSREVRDIMLKADSVNEDYYPPEEDDDEDIDDLDEPENSKVLTALNAIDVAHFKNIDDDDDDDDEVIVSLIINCNFLFNILFCFVHFRTMATRKTTKMTNRKLK
jgi:enhancer of mRNA-decapping protein 4